MKEEQGGERVGLTVLQFARAVNFEFIAGQARQRDGVKVGGIEDRKANRKCETACSKKWEVQDRSSQGVEGKTAYGRKGKACETT